MLKSVKQWCAGWLALAHDSQGEHLFPILCSMTSFFFKAYLFIYLFVY